MSQNHYVKFLTRLPCTICLHFASVCSLCFSVQHCLFCVNKILKKQKTTHNEQPSATCLSEGSFLSSIPPPNTSRPIPLYTPLLTTLLHPSSSYPPTRIYQFWKLAGPITVHTGCKVDEVSFGCSMHFSQTSLVTDERLQWILKHPQIFHMYAN